MKFFFFSLLSLCIAVPTSAFAGGSASADTSHIRTSGDTTFFINAEGKIHQLMIQRPNDQKMFNDFSLQSQLTVFDWASLSMGFSSPYFLNFLALRAEMMLGYLPIHVENQTERELGYSSGGGIAIRAKLKQWTTETYSAKGMKTSMARLYVDNGLLFTSQESKGIANFNVVLKHELGVEFGFAGQSTVSFFLGYMGRGHSFSQLDYGEGLFFTGVGYRLYSSSILNFFKGIGNHTTGTSTGGAWLPFEYE